MTNVNFRIKDISVRSFSSICNTSIYGIDLLIRVLFLAYIMFVGIIHTVIITDQSDFSGFFFMYSISAVLWGLLLSKFVLVGGKTFGKSRYDLIIMGILMIALISSLFSSNNTVSIFGREGTWSFSILTFISISILYYITVLVFGYARGIKWLLLGIILSSLLGGIVYTWGVIREVDTKQYFFITFCTYALPILVAALFFLRKLFLKIIVFIAILLNLFLISYYTEELKFVFFLMSMSFLLVLLFYYFFFWTRNILKVRIYLRHLWESLGGKRKKSRGREKALESKGRMLTVFGILLAILIITSAIIIRRLYQGLEIDFLELIRNDVGRIDGFKMWIIGNNNLNQSVSFFEFINILSNYGIIALIIYTSFFLFLIYDCLRIIINALSRATWEFVAFASSMLLVSVTLFLHFLLSRFDPVLLMLLIYIAVTLGVYHNIHLNKDLYSLKQCLTIKERKLQILRGVLVILLITLIVLGILGLFSAVDNDLF